jgi:hypothetical protein
MRCFVYVDSPTVLSFCGLDVGTRVRPGSALAGPSSADAEERRVAMASRGLTEDEWVASVSCRWCRSRHDESNMLLCDSCGAGCHYYCGPVALTALPPDDGTLWLCLFCTRGENLAIWDVESRPPPMSNHALQESIGKAVMDGYAASTVVYDDRVFVDFSNFIELNYGYVLARNVDFFNGMRCVRHRSESVSGYLTSLDESLSAPLKDPFAALCALRRAFRLHSLLTDAFGSDGLSVQVARGLRMRKPPVPQIRKVGVTSDMLLMARADASGSGLDWTSMMIRLLGLASVYAYCAGARVSEFAWTNTLNKHTVTRDMVHVVLVDGMPSAIEIYPRSSKNTSFGRRISARPGVIRFNRAVSNDPETDLMSFVCGALVGWLRDSSGVGSDPVFSFRHGGFRKCLTREDFGQYTKGLSVACDLPPASFSTKSWKIGKVSRGVLNREDSACLLKRGNHRSLSANRHYRPVVSVSGSVSLGLGIPRSFAGDEIRRDAFLRQGVPVALSDPISSDSDSEGGLLSPF